MAVLLISGASGYLAGRVIEHFSLQTDYELLALSRKNLPEEILSFKNVQAMTGELDNPGVLDKINQVDGLIHLAAPNEIICAEQPLKSIQTQLSNTWNLIHAAHQKGMKRMIYMSTVHVYGSPLSGTITEATLPFPNHPYALMHFTSENTARYLSKKLGFELIIFRLSNAFGSPLHANTDRWKLLVNELCREAVEKGSITIKTTGLQKRNFIPISDVCDILKKSFDKDQIPPDTYNLCSNSTIAVIEMAQKIKSCADSVLGRNIDLKINQQAEVITEYQISNTLITGKTGGSDSGWEDEIKKTLRFAKKLN